MILGKMRKNVFSFQVIALLQSLDERHLQNTNKINILEGNVPLFQINRKRQISSFLVMYCQQVRNREVTPFLPHEHICACTSVHAVSHCTGTISWTQTHFQETVLVSRYRSDFIMKYRKTLGKQNLRRTTYSCPHSPCFTHIIEESGMLEIKKH